MEPLAASSKKRPWRPGCALCIKLWGEERAGLRHFITASREGALSNQMAQPSSRSPAPLASRPPASISFSARTQRCLVPSRAASCGSTKPWRSAGLLFSQPTSPPRLSHREWKPFLGHWAQAAGGLCPPELWWGG